MAFANHVIELTPIQRVDYAIFLRFGISFSSGGPGIGEQAGNSWRFDVPDVLKLAVFLNFDVIVSLWDQEKLIDGFPRSKDVFPFFDFLGFDSCLLYTSPSPRD